MKITRNQAEDFVHFGEDHYSNLKILKDMIYVYWVPLGFFGYLLLLLVGDWYSA